MHGMFNRWTNWDFEDGLTDNDWAEGDKSMMTKIAETFSPAKFNPEVVGISFTCSILQEWNGY